MIAADDFSYLNSSLVLRLYLSGCDIQTVEPESFVSFSLLQSLSLSENHNLNGTALQVRTLYYLGFQRTIVHS